MKDVFVHESSYIDDYDTVEIGEGTEFWYFCHVQSNVKIGKNCIFEQNVWVGPNSIVGDGCIIKDNINLGDSIILEDYVFCGPLCTFTNDLTPRSEFPKGSAGFKKTIVRRGASIGANATIVCDTELGEYCVIGPGSIVTKDVKPHAFVFGAPAKQIGWACKCGQILPEDLVCVDCGRTYTLKNEQLVRIKK